MNRPGESEEFWQGCCQLRDHGGWEEQGVLVQGQEMTTRESQGIVGDARAVCCMQCLDYAGEIPDYGCRTSVTQDFGNK